MIPAGTLIAVLLEEQRYEKEVMKQQVIKYE